VSAIVVNYEGREFIADCLSSLLAQTRPLDSIMVIDNASSDGSAELVEKSFPEVDLIRLAKNVGYPAACNLGIEKSRSDLVAVLNNDLVLDSGWLETLLNQDCEPWDFWASQILTADEPRTIDSAGDGMAVVGSAYKIGNGDAPGSFPNQGEVFGPCAAAAVYRRTMLEELGGFDEDFFLIYEDADLSMRARLRGHRCLYVPEALVYHRVNQSIGTFSHNYVYYGHRNSECLFWKNMPTALLILYFPERCLFNLLAFLYFAYHGRAGSFLSGKIDFLKRLPKLLRKRKEVQAGRLLSNQDIKQLLDRNWLRYRRKPLAKS
jgi:GT2 family glycosyltransferase